MSLPNVLGVATSAVTGVTVGQTFTHTQPDLLIVWDVVDIGAAGDAQLDFRRQNALNEYLLALRGDGTLILFSRIANTVTVRINTGAGAYTTGARVVLDVRGGVHRAHVNGALVGNYTDAGATFATETAAQFVANAPNGTYNIAFYPNTARNRAALGV